MSSERPASFEEILAAVDQLSDDDRARLKQALKPRENAAEKARLRIIEEGARSINETIGALLSDDVPVARLNIGTEGWNSPHKTAVDEYLAAVDSLPAQVASIAGRATNCAVRGRISTIGQLREAHDKSLLAIPNFGAGSLTYVRIAFAKPEPQK